MVVTQQEGGGNGVTPPLAPDYSEGSNHAALAGAMPQGGKMSRITLKGKTPNLTVVVGLDRPMQQWFYQVWDSKVSEDNPVKDSMSEVLQGGASRGDMLEVISEFAEESERRSLVEHAIALDTDPGVFFIF